MQLMFRFLVLVTWQVRIGTHNLQIMLWKLNNFHKLVLPKKTIFPNILHFMNKSDCVAAKFLLYNNFLLCKCVLRLQFVCTREGQKHRLIKTQIGHARDFAWYRSQRPSPAHDSVTQACTDTDFKMRDKSATLRVHELLLCDILILRAGDGHWPRYQAKFLGCQGVVKKSLQPSFFSSHGCIYTKVAVSTSGLSNLNI